MPRPLRTAPLAALLAAAALLAPACAAGDRTPPASTSPAGTTEAGTTEHGTAAADELTGELRIFAAASLQAAFDELATRFEQRHPSLDVKPITYDGSATLVTQLIEGAPVDVFASADENNMRKVVDAGLATGPELFATNTLVLIVPSGDPGGVDGIADLADPDLAVVLCAAEVPCGAASATLLSNAGVTASVDSYEQNVTAVLTKVAVGEADAGLVYVTDAATTTAVETVEVDGAEDVVNRYPIVALRDAANPEAAGAFVAFVAGEEGREVLEMFGFGAP